MATVPLQAESALANPHNTIHRLALEIQTDANRVRHLLGAIDDAADNASFADVDRKTLVEMLDRVMVFSTFADAAMKAVQDKAEQLEVLSMKLKPLAAA